VASKAVAMGLDVKEKAANQMECWACSIVFTTGSVAPPSGEKASS
jgi:hypothetical protein